MDMFALKKKKKASGYLLSTKMNLCQRSVIFQFLFLFFVPTVAAPQKG